MLRTTYSRMRRRRSILGHCCNRFAWGTRQPRTRWRRCRSTISRRTNISGRRRGASTWWWAGRGPEDILAYLSEGSRQHLITAFWEYLILLEVAYKLLEKDEYTHRHNHDIRELYLELQATYKVEDFSVEGDFSERLMVLSQRISDEYRTKYGTGTEQKLTTEQVTELLYRHDLAKLRDLISNYLERKAAVWILFDNLDKGWSTQ